MHQRANISRKGFSSSSSWADNRGNFGRILGLMANRNGRGGSVRESEIGQLRSRF